MGRGRGHTSKPGGQVGAARRGASSQRWAGVEGSVRLSHARGRC